MKDIFMYTFIVIVIIMGLGGLAAFVHYGNWQTAAAAFVVLVCYLVLKKLGGK